MKTLTEFYKTRKDGVNLYRTYSDEDFYILQDQTRREYTEAIDIENSGYTYTETDKKIERIDPEYTQEFDIDE